MQHALSMIGAAAHNAAALYQMQLENQRQEEKARRHKAKQLARQQAAQAQAKAITEQQKQQIKAKQAAEEAAQGGEGAESFVAGAAGRDEDEVELYSNYQPGRVREGKPHPDPIVETASLAGVAPPEPKYEHHLHDCITKGQLSNCQMETVIYAFMRFQKRLANGNRAGFFLGDGAGVGKGRQIAAIIKEENARSGSATRALWLSVSNDLRFDAARDLKDVGAGQIKVFPEGSSPLVKGPIDKHHKTGVMFLTYSLLIAGLKKGNLQSVDEQNVDTNDGTGNLPTPESLGVNKDSRLAQIVTWLRGNDGKGECLIILDECHKAKNLIAKEGQVTQTGKAVGILQDLLPNARVLYSSATGASEPNNLGYMYRLGAAGFDHMKDMIDTLTNLLGTAHAAAVVQLRQLNPIRTPTIHPSLTSCMLPARNDPMSGLGAMELFAMGLKATGSYLSRTLSYKGADFEIAKMDIAPEFGVMYDRSSDLWQMLFHICSGLGPGLRRSFWSQFFSAQMRFYRQMLMAAKVKGCAKLANNAVANDMCVVIGLQSTGEANTNQMRDEHGDEMEDFISAPKQIMYQFLSKHFPTSSCDMQGYELDVLQHQVSQAVDAWRALPTAGQAALSSPGSHNLNPARGLTAAIPGPANMPRSAATMPRSPPGPPAASEAASSSKAAAKAADSDSDDGLELVGEQSLDDVLLARRQHAERTGQMIDLTKNNDPEEVIRTAKRLEEEHKQAEEAEAAAKLSKLLEPLQLRVTEAQADLDKALANLATEESQHPSSSDAASSPAEALVKSEGGQSGTKRRSPLQPASQPTAKKGRLQLKRENSDEQSDPDFMADDSSPAPKSRNKSAGRSRQLVESDEDYSQPSPSSGSKLKAEASEIDLTDTACEVCSSTDNADDMLLCDRCDRGYHLKCLSPQMDAVPEGDWFCSNYPTTKLQPSPKAKPKAAQQVVSEDSDTDAENFRPVLTKPTARQATIFNLYAEHERCNPNPKVRLLALKRKVDSAERRVEACTNDLQKAEVRAKADKDRKEAKRKATKQPSAAAEATPAPGKAARVKPEPGSAVANSSAKRPPTTGRRPTAKHGGGRDGYAVATDVLDDDWAEEFEVVADDEEGPTEECPQMIRIREMLLRLLGIVELPPNPLDHLTDLMGGETAVAEMTGRKGLLIRNEDGTVTYEKRLRDERVSQKMINMREKEAFMEGRKNIAIISDAASVGISLQADKRVGNQRRRCHLTLELPWSADKAIQQFGRSHRSNQVSAPIYRIVVTDCAGEYRFASSAAKRLQSLGALLSADRRALGAGEDLKTFDVDNKWGRKALERILMDTIGQSDAMPAVKVPRLPDALKGLGADGGWPYGRAALTRPGQDFYKYMRTALTAVGLIDKNHHSTGDTYAVLEKSKKVTKFLNRMLAMSLRDQKLLFTYFSDTLDAVIEEAKSKGQYEHGIVNLQAQSITTVSRELLHVDKSSDARTYYSRMQTVHGVSWDSATQYRDDYIKEKMERGATKDSLNRSGFYLSTTTQNQGQTGYTWIMLCTAVRKNSKNANQFYRVQRPNNSSNSDMQEGSMLQGYRKINDNLAKKHWDFWYEHLKTGCVHANSCSRRRRGEECYTGTSTSQIHVVHGAVLPIWKVLADTVLPDEEKKSRYDTGGKKDQAHVVRLKLDSGEPIVGLAIHYDDVSRVMGAVEEKWGQVDDLLQQQDTADWDRQNKQREANAAAGLSSKGTTPAKASAQKPVKRAPIQYDEIIEIDV